MKKIHAFMLAISMLAAAGNAAAGTNLLLPQGADPLVFSAGPIKPWLMFGNVDSTTAVRSVERLPAGTSSKIVLKNASTLGGILQFVRAEEWRGKVLTLRGRLKVSGDDAHSVGLWLRADDEKWQTLSLENMSESQIVGTTDWVDVKIALYVPSGALWLRAGVMAQGSATVEIADMTLQPASASRLAGAEMSPALREFLELVEGRSLRFDPAKGASLRAAVMAGTYGDPADPAQFQTIAKLVLRSLGDSHSFFAGTQLASARQDEEAHEPRPELDQLSGGIAVLRILGLLAGEQDQSDRYAAAGRDVIRHADMTCGLIIDLRKNTGGNMWPMLAALAPILPSGTIGGFAFRDGAFESWVNDHGQIRLDGEITVGKKLEGAQPSPQHVAVLIGPDTASSGEAVAVALKSIADARFFGRPTTGLVTGNARFELRDGNAVWLETTRFTDAARKPFNGSIVPDEGTKDVDALPAAQRWISSRCSGTAH